MKINVNGRPLKVRQVKAMPKIQMFTPRGKPGRPEEIHLTFDQFEALKLADLEGRDQADGAGILGVSRATFGRILEAAHRNIADALVNGKIIKIFGGSVQVQSNSKDFPKKQRVIHPQ